MFSRRQWIHGIGWAAAGAVLPRTLGGCSSDGAAMLPPGYANAAFETGSTDTIVWAMAPSAAEALIEIDGVAEAVPLAIAGASATGSTLVEGLASDTLHRYRVWFSDDVVSPWCRFRTAPADTADASFTFLVSADIGPVTTYYPIIDTFASDAAFYVNLGDWPYADKPPDPAVTEDEYRARHRAARDHDALRRLLSGRSIFAIYDDHDVRDGWDGATSATEPEQVAAALVAWDEFFPLRAHPRYRRWSWGRHAEFFMLDTRLYRSANDAPDGRARTLLGLEQKAWLLDALRTSAATFKIVLSSVPLDHVGSDDSWEAFATERDEIFEAIGDGSVRNVVFVSGDRHYFASHRHPQGVRELLVGPLAAGLGRLPDEQPAEVLVRIRERNYAEITIAGDSLIAVCRGPQGESLYREEWSPA